MRSRPVTVTGVAVAWAARGAIPSVSEAFLCGLTASLTRRELQGPGPGEGSGTPKRSCLPVRRARLRLPGPPPGCPLGLRGAFQDPVRDSVLQAGLPRWAPVAPRVR